MGCKSWTRLSWTELAIPPGFPGGSDGKESACNAGKPGWFLGQKDPLEKGMATHSSVLALRTPRTEELDGLQSMELQESDSTEQLPLLYHQQIRQVLLSS